MQALLAASALFWAGHNFTIKSGRAGPGPNLFLPDNAWVNNTTGDLALLLQRDAATGAWGCAEVVLDRSLGYGTYTWWLRPSSVVGFDKGIVLGLFTYETDSREIDIELSLWDNNFPGANADFAVQPATVKRFEAAGDGALLRASYTWAPGHVDFSLGAFAWTHTGADVPPAGGERVHMNLWLFQGRSPASGAGATVLLQNFSFAPLAI